ncbi:OLC1v1023637C1 [Oldenlandia corymbosa var. corymbosa]|uniref:OLC1v1023637C1 n=1 Tax=Oldenlandia corymbosa var. corymbosa TaxID=529605 RepID=A0AAV1C3C4_OLDCO|nr:OLC1v1023637C1 [Oldenlandia corymbosa var. corymbosa]
METIATVLSSCVILLLSALIWRSFNWVWLTPKKLEKHLKKQGLRGNPYRLLFGDLKDISALLEEAHSKPVNISDDIVPRVIPQFLETIKKYGKKTYIWVGPKPIIFIMDPELIKEVTQKIYLFQKPHINPLAKLLVEGLGSYEGDKWAKHRKIVNPAFHVEKLKLMVPSFRTCAREMLSEWEEISSSKASFELDVWPSLQNVSCDAISRTAFGSSYQEGRRIFELQKEQTEYWFKVIFSVYIPGWRFMPTKTNRRMKQIAKDVEDKIMEIIKPRIEGIQAGEAYDRDLLGMLLESNFKEIENHGHDSAITIREVIEECKLFYFAGQETTSVLLVWTMFLLSRHPDWQERARDEVLQLFGNKEPDFEGLNHLKIVTMILWEVLRLYVPVPMLTRTIAEETRLGDLSLPAGALVSLPAMLLHRDPEIWGEDANEFRPERFAEGVSNATKGQVAFFPFGWGPRICIGQNFAMLEAKLVLAMILQRFSFHLSPAYSHAPRSIITLQPQYGAHLVLQKL